MCPRAEESCSEQLLWKPLDELKDSTSLQEKGNEPQKEKGNMKNISIYSNEANWPPKEQLGGSFFF